MGRITGRAASALLAAVGLVTAVAVFASTPAADAGAKGWKLPKGAVHMGGSVYKIGTKKVKGRLLTGLAILDYKKGHARGGVKGKPDKGGGGGSKCYSFMAKGFKWKVFGEDYLVDPSGNNIDTSLTSQEILDSIDQAILDWEDAADGTMGDGNSVDVFGDRVSGTIDHATIGESTNDQNEVIFGPISESGVIAVTIVWGWFSGPPSGREIVEWDQIYDDDGDWTWGDSADSPNAGFMDFWNIAEHEIGHSFGMDHPDGCPDETMFGTAGVNEVTKRDLNSGDIAGIDALY